MTAAGGFRVWLQTRRWAWLTRARLKRITVLAFALATVLAALLPA